MSEADKFIQILLAEVGYTEQGGKDGQSGNITKYWDWYKKKTKKNFQGNSWCGVFLDWGMSQVKGSAPSTVYTPAGVSGFQGRGAWSNAATAKPKVGDFGYCNFDDDPESDHVFAVVKDNGDGTVTTVEGNTTPDGKKGSQSNGGQVALKIRAYKKNNARKLPVYVIGFGSPKWSTK